MNQILKILELMTKKKILGKGLYLSLKQSYNINSKIHPSRKKLVAYSDPILAILSSFRWENNEVVKSFNGKDLKLIEKKKDGLKKLNKKRYLYLVNESSFIPHDKGKNVKYFSLQPALIIQKETIENVYDKLKKIKYI